MCSPQRVAFALFCCTALFAFHVNGETPLAPGYHSCSSSDSLLWNFVAATMTQSPLPSSYYPLEFQ